MQINLPDHPGLLSKANAAGFANVADYVRHLIEADAGPLDRETAARQHSLLSFADWERRFDELLASLQPGNPHFDDSRESIYSIR